MEEWGNCEDHGYDTDEALGLLLGWVRAMILAMIPFFIPTTLLNPKITYSRNLH